MLVGAWARDLCLPVHQRREARKTNDADLAIIVDSWEGVDRFFAAAETQFYVTRPELFMRHRESGVQVDVVPCGALEGAQGVLSIRGSRRVMNIRGLAEAFDVATPHTLQGRVFLVPPPCAFVHLKLLAFIDRRAPRDLRDVGHVVRYFEYDALNDAAMMERFADGLTFEDAPAWGIGATLANQFTAGVRDAFCAALGTVAAETPGMRGLLASHILDPDQRVEAADRIIRLLRAGAESTR